MEKHIFAEFFMNWSSTDKFLNLFCGISFRSRARVFRCDNAMLEQAMLGY